MCIRDRVKTYKCLLKAGHTAEPERYSDKIQVFSFTSGTGYICGEKKAYNIEELSFYIPDFDHEKFSIYAAEDMEIVLWVIDMLESDRAAYEDTHMVLPSFKRFSECEPYDPVSYTHLDVYKRQIQRSSEYVGTAGSRCRGAEVFSRTGDMG